MKVSTVVVSTLATGCRYFMGIYLPTESISGSSTRRYRIWQDVAVHQYKHCVFVIDLICDCILSVDVFNCCTDSARIRWLVHADCFWLYPVMWRIWAHLLEIFAFLSLRDDWNFFEQFGYRQCSIQGPGLADIILFCSMNCHDGICGTALWVTY